MKLHVVFEDGSIADLENIYSVRLFTEGKYWAFDENESQEKINELNKRKQELENQLNMSVQKVI